MRKHIGVLLVLGLTGGCTSQLPHHPAAQHPVSRHATRGLSHGTNTIVGKASVSYSDGLATCAGDAATLVPDTAYAQTRLKKLYGDRNFVEISTAPRLPRDRKYEAHVRHVRCDDQGRFRFDRVPDGTYVVIAPLRQPGQSRMQGESVRKTVSVHGGEISSIFLTH